MSDPAPIPRGQRMAWQVAGYMQARLPMEQDEMVSVDATSNDEGWPILTFYVSHAHGAITRYEATLTYMDTV